MSRVAEQRTRVATPTVAAMLPTFKSSFIVGNVTDLQLACHTARQVQHSCAEIATPSGCSVSCGEEMQVQHKYSSCRGNMMRAQACQDLFELPKK